MGAVKQIVNPAGLWGGQPGWANPNNAFLGANDQIVVEALNNSGGTLLHGDVVIIDTSAVVFPAVAVPPNTPQSGGYAVTTTTTANSPLVAGVVTQSGDASSWASPAVPAGATCMICVAGVARVNIGAGAVAANGLLSTIATAKQAGTAATALGNLLGVALEANGAKDAQNTIRALIKLG